MQKQSARIKCKNNLFKPFKWLWAKQPHAIKTIIYNDIFTSLRRKKIQSSAKHFKKLFSLGLNHFRWNGIFVSRFNHVCFEFRRRIARARCFTVFSLYRLQNFSVSKWCDIQGSHSIGYLWFFFDCWPIRMSCLLLLCTELTLFCTDLPENCIYFNQSDLSNFFMYIISDEICV